MEKEEFIYLKELIKIFDTTAGQLKAAYDSKEAEKFNYLKKALLNVQEKISRVTK
jgi:hypothetical protein